MDISEYNRNAWDAQVAKQNKWTRPVSEEAVAAARAGTLQIVLTPQKAVPRHWFPKDLAGLEVLCLAAGGGQQAALLAAAGAVVTVLDNSPKQLEQDKFVANRDGLRLRTVLGDMRCLDAFENDCFDLVFNPCSICFVPDPQPVFDSVARVLRKSGRLMCGFTHPFRYIFDETLLEAGKVQVRHALPYADETRLGSDELEKLRNQKEPFFFSHSLEDLIAGQLRAGLSLVDLFEDEDTSKLSEFAPSYFATLAQAN